MNDSAKPVIGRGKGRPEAPYKIERLAIATHHVNQGKSFKAAAEMGVIFFRYDFETRSYVPDIETNLRLPQTRAGRRTSLYKIRKEQLIIASSRPTRLFEKKTKPNEMPVAFRLKAPLERGRPKKR